MYIYIILQHVQHTPHAVSRAPSVCVWCVARVARVGVGALKCVERRPLWAPFAHSLRSTACKVSKDLEVNQII